MDRHGQPSSDHVEASSAPSANDGAPPAISESAATATAPSAPPPAESAVPASGEESGRGMPDTAAALAEHEAGLTAVQKQISGLRSDLQRMNERMQALQAQAAAAAQEGPQITARIEAALARLAAVHTRKKK